MITLERKFVFYFYFVGWTCLSLGFHIDFKCPNIEIHLPFGFFRIGYAIRELLTKEEMKKNKTFGYEPEWDYGK